MDIKIKIDASAIAKEFKEFQKEVEADLKKGVASLASITHAKVAEMAQQELKSSRKQFMDSLHFEEVDDGIWVVSVDAKAFWIEEGISPNFDMKPGLLKNAQTNKKGGKYKVVPFEHSKAPSQLTPKARAIVNEIRTNLKKENVPFKGIERNADGSPRIGKLHSFDWTSDKPGRGNTPVLHGVSIYQSIKGGNVRRDILTFRTVTDKQTDKWIHPGLKAKKFLDRAADWAVKEWEDKILPDILNKWK